MTELEVLRKALNDEAEITPAMMQCFPRHPDIPTHHLFQAILTDGDDLSAALKIHKALVPAWHPVIHMHAVRLDHRDFPEVLALGKKPARTWLTAIVDALIVAAADYDQDGYTVWYGGDRPVPLNTLVAVKVRSGIPRDVVPAGEWPQVCWRHRPIDDHMSQWNIVAYKVIK